MRRIRVILFIFLVSLTAGPSAALEISRVTGCSGSDVLKLRGQIEGGDYVRFRSYFSNPRRIVGLDLDSSGGLLYEGFRIASLTRQKRLSTYVSNECDSACAFIFLMGNKRYISKGAKIGVHAVGNDRGGEDAQTIRDTIELARLSAKLGIPSSAIGKMVTTRPGKITFLDQADLSALKAIVRYPFAGTVRGNGPQNCSSDRDTPGQSARNDTSTARISRNPINRETKHAGFARPNELARAASRAP